MTGLTYQHSDAVEAKRKLMAMLPAALRIHTGVYNDGLTLAIVVANRDNVSKLYEFGWRGRSETSRGEPAPQVSDLGLMHIVTEWRSGIPVELGFTAATSITGSSAREVKTRDEFQSWLRDPKVPVGSRCLYFRGPSVSTFRHQAPIRILELQRLSDAARPSEARSSAESVELQHLQDTLDLIASVSAMNDTEMVALTSRRSVENEGFIFYATKRAR